MPSVRRFLAVALILLTAFAASAHDTWLLARHAYVAPGVRVWLDLTSGMTFPALESAIKPERVNIARCRVNSKTVEIAERASASKSLALRVRMPDSGIATVWVELKPKSLELTPKQVEEYLDEINAPASLRQSWKTSAGTNRWREIYTKHAKTFVRVGEAISDHSWAEPAGMTLEIVPEKNPTTLRAGEDFPVRVLRDGSPLPNFSLGIVREGNTFSEFQTTDANGRVIFRIARSGKWLLRGTELRPSNKPETEWESDFTTLTIEVR
jgi:uncharacterized GH25 family protein